MSSEIDAIISKLKAQLTGDARYQPLETEWLEIKRVPPTQGEWDSICESICAFLNTRGGVLLLGVREEMRAPKKYELTGWKEDAENKLKSFRDAFTDFRMEKLDIGEEIGLLADQRAFLEIRPVLGKNIAILTVNELPPERKPCLYKETAYRRVGTGDQSLDANDLDRYQSHSEEAQRGTELSPVSGTTIQDVDLDKLNHYITLINRQVRHETVKSSVESAKSFLRRKSFLLESGEMSTLGYLVCGLHPEDRLGFACQVHAFLEIHARVEGASRIADDKKIFAGSVIDLMEETISFILQKLQIATTTRDSGQAEPELPEPLLRETVNNALAHRDYVIDKAVSVWVRPGREVEIRNPGCFRKGQLIEKISATDPIRRIVPDPRPRNPKLAGTLGLFSRWEGQGIGMSTLVNLCLEDRIDLPIYRIQSHSEVTLFLRSGTLVDDEMTDIFKLYDRFISKRLRGRALKQEERVVLSYVIKARRAEQRGDYSIILTNDNNHFQAIGVLERSELIRRHPKSDAVYAVYEPNPDLLRNDFDNDLEESFGVEFRTRSEDERRVLTEVYKHGMYSSIEEPSARMLAQHFFHRQPIDGLPKRFEDVYRGAKRSVERLRDAGFLVARTEPTKSGGKRVLGYALNRDFIQRKLGFEEEACESQTGLRPQPHPRR